MTLTLNRVRAVDARRMHADQDAARADSRSFDVAGFQDLGPAEPIEDNCLHSHIPGVRAPVVEPERSPYYTAAQTGPCSDFLLKD